MVTQKQQSQVHRCGIEPPPSQIGRIKYANNRIGSDTTCDTDVINQFFDFVVNSFRLQDEFLDVVYWSRQVVGILIGILWGILPLKGFVAIAL